jgi:preprotein translocase subunit SecG
MYGLLLALHLIVCLCLVTVILVQSGKGGGLAGGAFGGATQTVFGGRGATDFITRATVVLGVLFFVTSLSLALLTTRGTGRARSIVSEAAKRAATTAPAAPGGAATPGGTQGGIPAGTPPAMTAPPIAPATPVPAKSAPAKPAPMGATKH